MNDFDYLANHKEDRIDGITVNDGGVKIKYATVNAAGKITKHTLVSPEPAHDDLVELMEMMNAWVKKYFINKADSEVTGDWSAKLATRGISFKHNNEGVTAQVSAIYRGSDGQAGELKTPATPLYDEACEGHECGAVDTFGVMHTPTLESIMQQARMYLGGKRGEMQTKLGDDEDFYGSEEE